MTALRNELMNGSARARHARAPSLTPNIRGLKRSHTPDGRLPSFDDEAAFDQTCGHRLREHAFLQARMVATGTMPAEIHHVLGPSRGEGVASFVHQSFNAAVAAAAGCNHAVMIGWADGNITDVLVPMPGGVDWSLLGPPAPLYQSSPSIDACMATPALRMEPSNLPVRSAFKAHAPRVHAEPMTAELAVGCVLGALFAPSPRLPLIVGPTFERTRTALTDPSTLSIALYFRSGDNGDNERPSAQSITLDHSASGQQARLRYSYAAAAACAYA